MTDIQRLAENWHSEWARAFITSVSGDGEYYIKAKFKTMAEMHAAYDSMAKLAALSAPSPIDEDAA